MQRPRHFACHAHARTAGRVEGIYVTKTVEHGVRDKPAAWTVCLHGGRHEEVILPVLRRPRDAEVPESSFERVGRDIGKISHRLPLVHTAGYVGRHEAFALFLVVVQIADVRAFGIPVRREAQGYLAIMRVHSLSPWED